MMDREMHGCEGRVMIGDGDCDVGCHVDVHIAHLVVIKYKEVLSFEKARDRHETGSSRSGENQYSSHCGDDSHLSNINLLS